MRLQNEEPTAELGPETLDISKFYRSETAPVRVGS